MNISNGLYSYPVLSRAGLRDDYNSPSEFNMEVEQKQTGANEFSIELVFTLNEPNLLELVESGAATISVHLESPLSGYRGVVPVDAFDMRKTIVLDGATMKRSLEVTAFIVASQPIEDFRSENFSDMYDGTYQMQRGDVLAFVPTVEVILTPDNIHERSAASIIKVHKYDKRIMNVEFRDDHIVIFLPGSTYDGYKQVAQKNSRFFNLSIMAVVVPALMSVIEEMKENAGEHEDKLWYKVIIARLKEEYGSNPSVYDDPLKIAQYLLDNPTVRAFEGFFDDDLPEEDD